MFDGSSPVPIRVLLVGLSPLLHDSLTYFLAATPVFQLSGQIDSDLTHLHFIKASPPDVLLVDVDLPNGLNLDLLTAVRQQFPGLPIAVLTACTQSGALHQLLALQLAAYLSKQMNGPSFVDALLAVAQSSGAMLIDPTLAKLLLAEHPAAATFAQRQASLTPRQQAVFALLLAGKTNQQIAHLLQVSVQTIRNYNRELYAKLGVKTRIDLLLLANQAQSDQAE